MKKRAWVDLMSQTFQWENREWNQSCRVEERWSHRGLHVSFCCLIHWHIGELCSMHLVSETKRLDYKVQ